MAMLKFLFCLFLILLFIAGLVFSFRNQSLIEVDLLFLQSSSFSIGFWLLVSLIAGFILGITAFIPKRLSQNIKIHRLSKKISENNIPLARVKSESSKGN